MIVADSHTLWILAPGKLSPTAKRAIVTADVVGIAAISCWEIAMLAHRQRIALDRSPADWFHEIVRVRNISVLPLTIDIGVRAAELHDILRDPIDCLIAATALTHGVALVTKDERIQRSGVMTTIW